jgi:alpha-L-rhamnosidase
MYGDWVVPPPAVMGNKSLIASFAMLRDLQIGIQLFNASAHPKAAAQAARLTVLRAAVASDFHKVFYNGTAGYYGSGLQTEQSLPLYLGIVPAAAKARVLARLVDDIVTTHKNHTTSGIIGWKCTLEVLAREGFTEVGLALLQQDSYPSLGYMLKGGAHGYEPATTLWELWDADVQGPSMNSRNHIMFGSVGAWLYKHLAGISPLEPGFKRTAIRPGGIAMRNLSHIEASVETPQGRVALSWDAERSSPDSKSIRSFDVLALQLEVPLGMLADVHIPLMSAGSISEGGNLIWDKGAFVPGVAGVMSARKIQGTAVVEFEVASGDYRFRST